MKKLYHPGDKFPSISVTGNSCSLACPHCDGRFLESMENISDPDDLYSFAKKLEDSGGNGFLLSGGCDEKGRVPIVDFCDKLKRIKEETSLQINVHTGIPSERVIKKLIESKIDIVSYDMIGSKETIENIYGIDATPEDYKEGYDSLRDRGLKVVPHITVGLNGGVLKGEFKAVEMIDKPEKLVLNTLIPLNFGKSVKKENLLSVVDQVDEGIETILGCMREKGRPEMEIQALKRGVKGIVLPSKRTEKWMKKNHEVVRLEKCCSF